MLSDRDLKQVIKDKEVLFRPPLRPDQIGPASIDLTLGRDFKVFKTTQVSLIDPKQGLPEDYMESFYMKDGKPFVLHPGDFVLASTKEYITVSDSYVVRVEGKSTLARMGILVHTAGFVDPGFEGAITLEISNQSNVAVALYAGMYICQVAVHKLSSPAEIPYNKRKKSIYARAKSTMIANPKNLFRKK